MPKSLPLAALLLAVIAAALATVALRTPTGPVSEPVAATTRVLVAPGYDLEEAMTLAGKEVPETTQEYAFFALVEDPVPADEVSGLAAALRSASDDRDFVGIAGPDPERNRRSTLAALRRSGDALNGLTVIYVGPAAHREELTRAVRASGAEIRYVTYPRSGPEV